MMRSVTLGLAACLAASAALAAGDADRGEQLYQACTDCHSLDKNDVGPRHRGVFGRKAASLPDYDYSDALKSANIVWNEETLDKWLTDPQAVASRRQDVLSSRQSAGPRRRDRLPQGTRQVRRAPAGRAG